MFKRFAHYYQRLPHYLSHRTSEWVFELFAPWLFRRCVPHLQDAPVIVFTMGKVGTTTLLNSLRNTGALFVRPAHFFQHTPKQYPYNSLRKVVQHRMLGATRLMHIPWLDSLPRLRVITVVREPISRILSIYLFSYSIRFGQKFEDTSLQTLLDDFPRLFEQDYDHPLVPGYFLANELQNFLGIDVYQHPSPRDKGTVSIEQGRMALLVMKLEILDEQKADALSDWMARPIHISRENTAAQKGYASIYEEFKHRVRIPYRYAEAIYRSSYMQHFYTPEEHTKFWQRWEPQLDKSIPLPDWVEHQLQKYHPPVD